MATYGKIEEFDRESDSWEPYIERDRKSVVQGKSVDLGGRRIIKKKKSKDQ